MIEVVNRQRGRKIATAVWINQVQAMLEALDKSTSSVTIAFVSDRKMRELNRQFRGIDRATDVLSFPSDQDSELNDTELSDELGDIAVSVETAARQAKENDLTLNGEIAQLILHGLLHLSGYDHETDNGEMNRLEWRMRKKLRI